MSRDYTFETIEEYENYLDRLYEMLSTRVEQSDKKLQTIDMFNQDDYGESVIPNIKYFCAIGSKKAYVDCLTFFEYAKKNNPRNIRIYDKILDGVL